MKLVRLGPVGREVPGVMDMEIPSEPVVFVKASNTIVGPHDDVIIPRTSRKIDWEVELAVVIGRATSYLDDQSDAAAHIAGYTISNDVSEREFQLERRRDASCRDRVAAERIVTRVPQIGLYRNLDLPRQPAGMTSISNQPTHDGDPTVSMRR